MSTVKQKITPAFLRVTAGVSILLLGICLAATVGFNRSRQSQQPGINIADSRISPLLHLPPAQRAIPLAALAQLKNSQVANRARYLLAMDWIERRQGEKALTNLVGLEQDYPVLAAEITFKRGQASELAGNRSQAEATWRDLLKRYREHPVAAEALYALGRTQPRYWDQAIAQFPSHPRTIQIVQARLKQNPKQPQLLLLLARHALYLSEITSTLDRLSQYQDQLQPQDWEAIAFGYWQKQTYGKAAKAYARAPRTPLNAYRTARGLQLDGQDQQATLAYQRMVTQFPTAKETPRALIRLATLIPPKQALQSLDRAIQLGQPLQAGEALLAKANLLDQLNSQGAAQARQLLLTTYSNTDAAAELRWQEAEKRAENQDFSSALKLAQQITAHNPDSELAPQATFWTGKWANRLGSETTAKRAFKQVLSDYPESYYAWRTAALLGLPVGDFTSVRHLDPEIVKPDQRLALPAGSAALKELYQLRQDRDAWVRWQWEYQVRPEPTMEEQLTDGLLRLGVGDNLEGLFLVSDLKARSRSEPENRPQYQTWQQQPKYWQALYPLPFVETVEGWSQQRDLNPLLVMALIRQESRFQPAIRSSAGAVGLMQVMPGTASWIAEQTKLSRYALAHPNDNVKLGTWYLDYTHQAYDGNSMLAVASYNAGPGNVANWVKQEGLSDPDEFVEAIPFSETKGYVKAVFENYWNYLRLYNPEISEVLQKYA